MTTEQGNILIANYLGLKLKTDGKTWELDSKLQNILKLKTTQCLKFNENLDMMFVVLEKISTIKDLFITTTYGENKCYIFLYYKSQEIEGEYRNSKFSTSREKELSKYKQALFEVITNFLGWLENNPSCKSEIEYELDHVIFDEKNNQNIVFMKPIEETVIISPEEKKE